jgi:two-component system KDP operon response regulator KdpE
MSDTGRILIVDDEPEIRRFLRAALVLQGYEILEAASGSEALAQMADSKPDLVVLDMQLGDTDGQDILRRVREWGWTPVLVLTVRNREMDKVRAFQLGADDYLTKPFSIAEFLGRVKAILRRAGGQAASPVFEAGELQIDLARRQVQVGGRAVRLTPKQYGLLQFLARHAGRVVTHDELLQEVWGAEHAGDVHYLRIFMRGLRKRIEVDATRPVYIHTELGVGYRLCTADQLETRIV